jgi:hypothetical protein
VELEVLRIFLNVVDRRLETRVCPELDQAVGLEQQKRPGFVGGIVRNGDLRAVGQRVKRGGLSRVDAQRLVVDGDERNQIGALFRVEVVKIGLVLEEVRVKLAVLQGYVRLHVVGEFPDLELVALARENFSDDCEYFRMGRGTCADHDFRQPGGGAFRRRRFGRSFR